MSCERCGTALTPGTTSCPSCGATTLDGGDITVRYGSTSRSCPRCRRTLEAVLLEVGEGPVELDCCLVCRGIFFDPGEVGKVLRNARRRPAGLDRTQLARLGTPPVSEPKEETAALPCPDCRRPMRRQPFGKGAGVIADSCRRHGLWLDGGELHRVLQWRESGGKRSGEKRSGGKRHILKASSGGGRSRNGAMDVLEGAADVFGAILDFVDVFTVFDALS